MRENKQNRSKAKSSTLWMGIFVIGIFVGELFFYTWCRVQCTAMGYEMTRLENQYQKLAAIKSSLTVETARLKSPERIARTAKEQLGLMMPGPEQMVIMP
jgi:cell division protein FtsL